MSRALASMTGFGRAARETESGAIQCEIRSVNARGLDLRPRLSPGLDALEAPIRRLVGETVARGALAVSVSVRRQLGATETVVNTEALDAILDAMERLETRMSARKPAIEGILALKGVIETRDIPLGAEEEERLERDVLDCVAEALAGLCRAREDEGGRLGAVLLGQIEEIERLTEAAEAHPSRSREAILSRLYAQVAELAGSGVEFSSDRLHQEAVLLATRADIREEIDRLKAHAEAAKKLIKAGGAVGRRLDFLAQELNREANTLCSKSNDVELTGIGVDLKAVIDQYREQVQNLE